MHRATTAWKSSWSQLTILYLPSPPFLSIAADKTQWKYNPSGIWWAFQIHSLSINRRSSALAAPWRDGRKTTEYFVLVSPHTFIQAWAVFLTQKSWMNILHVSDFNSLTNLKNTDNVLLCRCDRVHETRGTPINEWIHKLWGEKSVRVLICFVWFYFV